jgi:hypothetical protein
MGVKGDVTVTASIDGYNEILLKERGIDTIPVSDVFGSAASYSDKLY